MAEHLTGGDLYPLFEQLVPELRQLENVQQLTLTLKPGALAEVLIVTHPEKKPDGVRLVGRFSLTPIPLKPGTSVAQVRDYTKDWWPYQGIYWHWSGVWTRQNPKDISIAVLRELDQYAQAHPNAQAWQEEWQKLNDPSSDSPLPTEEELRKMAPKIYCAIERVSAVGIPLHMAKAWQEHLTQHGDQVSETSST